MRNKEKALVALQKDEYPLARKLLLPLAEKGDVEAQCELGSLFQLGLGGDRDVFKAIYWLEKAAKSGSGLAAYNLGTLYMTCPPDLPVDEEKSKMWRGVAMQLGVSPFKLQ